MSNAWYLAPSLTLLRAEVNRRWPNRDRKSDGTIGDLRHQKAGTSDHNPNARRSVNALDVDRDGIDPMALVNVAISDARTNYVIFNRTIWSRSRGFTPRTYTGANPHTGHVHISIRQAKSAEQDTRPWGIATAASTKPGLPSSGVNPTTGGLSMSDIATLTAKLDALTAKVDYTQDQLRAVAGLVGSREALDADAARTRAAVRAELASQDLSGTVKAAIKGLGSPAVGMDPDAVAEAVVAAIAVKLGG